MGGREGGLEAMAFLLGEAQLIRPWLPSLHSNRASTGHVSLSISPRFSCQGSESPSNSRRRRTRQLLLRHRRSGSSFLSCSPDVPVNETNCTLATTAATSSSSVSTENSFEMESRELDVGDIKDRCRKWRWKGQYDINYFVQGSEREQGAAEEKPALLLVHGFGASILHWRRNIMTLAQYHVVYAVDLLGFGSSDKPEGFQYTMESWAELLLDFVDEIIQKPTVLIGNSVGSLACVIAASESSRGLVKGLVLLNCAGGMNNKAIVDDWRIKLLLPLLWLIDFFLNQKFVASFFFERVKQRDSIRNILLSIYGNKEAVDDTLVEIIREPADDEGAIDAFVSIVTGPPGPSPVNLVPKISLPVLILWGDNDPFTPLDGPVGKYFASVASEYRNVQLFVLEGVGHCPHDDRPNLVHAKLLPWLANLQM